VISRSSGYLRIRNDPAPAASIQLQEAGFVVLPGVLTAEEVKELEADIDRVFDEVAPDERVSGLAPNHWAPFRYEMLNRSETCQRAAGHPAVLEVIEPLLGEDCHVIANTAWRQPAEESDHGGRFWHIDSGPHIPRDPDVLWDDRIPYPVFAVATHLYLWDCPMEAGPTGVIPGSHTSGQPPPGDRMSDDDLLWQGQGVVPLVASAGDVALFVSDVWHRRLPSGPGDPGRFFLQCHYGRRDLAQRLRPTSAVNHLSDEAVARAKTRREQTLVGLHRPFFYDG
jgi:ectoine hydroxylase-related dioxygenase (phytanoyl-CoA dioxygenase family)